MRNQLYSSWFQAGVSIRQECRHRAKLRQDFQFSVPRRLTGVLITYSHQTSRVLGPDRSVWQLGLAQLTSQGPLCDVKMRRLLGLCLVSSLDGVAAQGSSSDLEPKKMKEMGRSWSELLITRVNICSCFTLLIEALCSCFHCICTHFLVS